jgi:glycosidase
MQKSVEGGGAAWEWSEVRKAFYLHQFHVDEPDLNFANPAVIDEFKVTNCVWIAIVGFCIKSWRIFCNLC